MNLCVLPFFFVCSQNMPTPLFFFFYADTLPVISGPVKPTTYTPPFPNPSPLPPFFSSQDIGTRFFCSSYMTYPFLFSLSLTEQGTEPNSLILLDGFTAPLPVTHLMTNFFLKVFWDPNPESSTSFSSPHFGAFQTPDKSFQFATEIPPG